MNKITLEKNDPGILSLQESYHRNNVFYSGIIALVVLYLVKKKAFLYFGINYSLASILGQYGNAFPYAKYLPYMVYLPLVLSGFLLFWLWSSLQKKEANEWKVSDAKISLLFIMFFSSSVAYIFSAS